MLCPHPIIDEEQSAIMNSEIIKTLFRKMQSETLTVMLLEMM